MGRLLALMLVQLRSARLVAVSLFFSLLYSDVIL